jgi:signal transduction histidine kinase
VKGAVLLVASPAPAALEARLETVRSAGWELRIADPAQGTGAADLAGVDLALVDHTQTGFDGFDQVAPWRAVKPRMLVLHLACDAATRQRAAVDTDLDFFVEGGITPDDLLTLLAALLRAERAERLRNDLLATLAHDLRTPLNSILGWADILQRQPRDADPGQGLQAIERNARLQAQLIADVLDLTRMIAGRFEIERGPIAPGFVIDAAIRAASEAAAPRQIAIERSGDALLPKVMADAERLQQVIASLLSNAVKFSARGASVQVDCARDGDQLRISVSDSGRGIAAEALPDVLHRFERRVPGARNAGLGLGLTIARHLVALHGGTLSAHSDGIGKGARFTIRLPIA